VPILISDIEQSQKKPSNRSAIDGGQNPLETALRPNYKDQSVNTVESCDSTFF